MDTKRVTPEAPSGERGPDVIDLGNGHFKVRSLSQPDIYRFVDLNRSFCSCPATAAKCRHKRIAEAADSTRPEYVIEAVHDSRVPGIRYRLVEVIAGAREVIGERPTWLDCFLDREEIYGGVS